MAKQKTKTITINLSVSTRNEGSEIRDTICIIEVPVNISQKELDKLVYNEAKEWLWSNIDFSYHYTDC